VGVLETAQNSIETFNAIIKLRQVVEGKKITTLGKRIPLAMELIRHLYSKSIVDANEIATALAVNISTAHRLIQDFEKLEILLDRPVISATACLYLKIILNFSDKNNTG
jgi:DNA-binding MarR family transcriptional regulator